MLMAQLALACKATSRACAKAGIADLFGLAGDGAYMRFQPAPPTQHAEGARILS